VDGVRRIPGLWEEIRGTPFKEIRRMGVEEGRGKIEEGKS
jgi:hypothetical protein